MTKINKLRVVLDTNVFLVSLAAQSPFALIFDALIEGKFELVVNSEIISEYEEVIGKRYDSQTVNNVLELILHLDNIHRQEVFYQWQLIEKDADDNKFADVYVASQANYLITNDRHFSLLKGIPFPPIQLLKAEDFIELLAKL